MGCLLPACAVRRVAQLTSLAAFGAARPFCAAPSGRELYDVVIVGGSLVGAALACSLGSHPSTSALRLAVIDRGLAPDLDEPLSGIPELRVSTLTPASIRLIKRAGAWGSIAPPLSAAFTHMQVWDWAGGGFVRYSASDVSEPQMGVVAENSILQKAFLRRLLELSDSANFFWNDHVQALKLPPYAQTETFKDSQGASLAEVDLASGERLSARLVIGADGASSHVRTLSGLRTFGWSYQQRGVVATVRTLEVNNTAWQRFLKTGPLALLPVRDGYSNIVWSTTPQHAAELERSSPNHLAAAVNEALTGGTTPPRNPFLVRGPAEDFQAAPVVLPLASAPAPRSFPLLLQAAGKYTRPRLALAGDAAHSVHPLAGQGANLGLGDVDALVGMLAHAVETGCDLGEPLLLEDQYETPRQRANGTMMAALDGLKYVFGPQSGLVAGVRALGLDVVHAVPPLKAQIMKYAMGI